MKIVSKELVALAIENELQEYNGGMILLPEKGIKIKGLFRFMGLVSFNATDQQVPKKKIFSYWNALLLRNLLTLFRVIYYPIINLVLICLNVLSSICNLVGKTMMTVACLIPIIYWFSQKSDHNKISVSELFSSYSSLFVWFMITIIFIKIIYLMTVVPLDENTKRINEFVKNTFLTPFTPIDLMHITIWFKSAEGKVVAADYNVNRDYYRLRFSKEELSQMLIEDKLTLDELNMYYNTLTSVDKFFVVDEITRKAKQSKKDYAMKLMIKRLAKNVYMKQKGIVKNN